MDPSLLNLLFLHGLAPSGGLPALSPSFQPQFTAPDQPIWGVPETVLGNLPLATRALHAAERALVFRVSIPYRDWAKLHPE